MPGMRMRGMSGFSLVETLIALALIATVSAALLPAIAIAARLHRDSAIATDAAIIGGAHLARLASAAAASGLGAGGSLDGALEGWRAHVDATGADVDARAAVFEVRSRISTVTGGDGVWLLAVRVVPLANRDAALTLTVVVPRA